MIFVILHFASSSISQVMWENKAPFDCLLSQ